jgi:hypothetical protein
MALALRDRPSLPADQRAARRAARVASLGGGAIGTGVVLHSVGTMGVAGYSAAGITSGLSALGAVTGGGMAAGLTLAMLIPALSALAAALLIFGLVRWLHSRSDRGPAISAT